MYTTECSEVSFSILLTLARDEDGRVLVEIPDVAVFEPAVQVLRPAPDPFKRLEKAEPQMVDASTGAGTSAALEQDLRLDRGYMNDGGFTLATVDVAPLPDIRRLFGDEAADEVLRALVEAVPFVLRTGDRIYRTGANELTMLLPSADLAGAATMCLRLQTSIRDVLTRRELPDVILSVRPYQAAA